MGFIHDIRDSRATLLAFVAMGLVWACFGAQVPVIKARIGADDAAFGLSFLISSLGALAAMWLAPVVDRKLGALSVLAASAAMGMLFLIPAVSAGLWLFTFGMFLAAAASGTSDILMNARISEAEAVRGRPLMNLNHAIYSFSYAGGAVLTGFAREAGWSPLAIFGVVGALIVVISPAMYRPHRRNAGGADGGSLVSGKVLVWMGGLVFLVGFMCEQAVEGWSALHIERTLGGGAAQGALGPAVLGLTMGIGRLFGQIIVKRVTDTTMIAIACIVSAFGVTLAALAPTIPLAYAGFGIMGLGVSVVVPLAMGFVGRVVPEDERVAAIGRASVIGYGAFLVGPSIIGITSDRFGLRVAFLLVAAMLVMVSVVLVPMIARRIRSRG
ncbi:MFS transporter [Arenibacterium sp. CAU 1754]